jgi:DNA polymerase I-like protein with 3'-5' exonuclease and polymerase domains
LVIREQMAAAGLHFKVAFQVHDEIIIAVPEDNALADQTKLEALMSTAPKWAPDLPVACESGMAANYGDT